MSWLFRGALWLVPGGQVAQILSAIASVFAKLLEWALAFVKWLMIDITDALKEPQRLAVRVTCLVAVLIVGLWAGIVHKARKDAAVIQAITKQRDVARAEVSQWRERHENEERRADAAEKARKEAEDKVRAAATPPAAPVQRVRPKAPAAAAKPAVFGLSGIFALPK